MLTPNDPRHQMILVSHPQIVWHRGIYLIQLILEQWHSFQEEVHKYISEAKLLQIPYLGLGQLALDVHLHGLCPVEDRRSCAVNSIKKHRLVSFMFHLGPRHFVDGQQKHP